MNKIFINLTNGIEALHDHGFSLSDVSFVRIQSSHIESHKFDEILQELDHNLLMNLAMGFRCDIYDYGARSDTAKALRIGIEWIRFVLYRRWLGNEYIPVIRFKNVTNYFNEQYNKLTERTKKKLDYYKKYIICDEIKLFGVNGNTLMDNKPDYYRDIIVKKIVC